MRQTLRDLNEELVPKVPLEPTVGDEFQACFEKVAEAVRASLMIRLELLRIADVDSRYGLGEGDVEVFSKSRPISQDGPGWWAARDAIESTKRLEVAQTSSVRTYFVARPRSRGGRGEAAALNAYLFCRDEMVHQMKQASRNRLYGLMRGWSQSQIAAEEGATQGAISQSLARSGAFAILAAEEELEFWRKGSRK
jgi:hypothetical protein